MQMCQERQILFSTTSGQNFEFNDPSKFKPFSCGGCNKSFGSCADVERDRTKRHSKSQEASYRKKHYGKRPHKPPLLHLDGNQWHNDMLHHLSNHVNMVLNQTVWKHATNAKQTTALLEVLKSKGKYHISVSEIADKNKKKSFPGKEAKIIVQHNEHIQALLDITPFPGSLPASIGTEKDIVHGEEDVSDDSEDSDDERQSAAGSDDSESSGGGTPQKKRKKAAGPEAFAIDPVLSEMVDVEHSKSKDWKERAQEVWSSLIAWWKVMMDDNWDDNDKQERERVGQEAQDAHRVFAAYFLLFAGGHVKSNYLHVGTMHLKEDFVACGKPIRCGTEGWEHGNKNSKRTGSSTVCFGKAPSLPEEEVKKQKVLPDGTAHNSTYSRPVDPEKTGRVIQNMSQTIVGQDIEKSERAAEASASKGKKDAIKAANTKDRRGVKGEKLDKASKALKS